MKPSGADLRLLFCFNNVQPHLDVIAIIRLNAYLRFPSKPSPSLCSISSNKGSLNRTVTSVLRAFIMFFCRFYMFQLPVLYIPLVFKLLYKSLQCGFFFSITIQIRKL
jgi:hypothetical protein